MRKIRRYRFCHIDPRWALALIAAVALSATTVPAAAQDCPNDANCCFTPGIGGGCDNETCCQLVCVIDPTCCANVWDQACADLAYESCIEMNDCLYDLDLGGVVGGSDLGILLGNWGNSGIGDVNGDCIVDGADLGPLLGAWGEVVECGCPGEGDCCSANGSRGCDDFECCFTVCAQDPFCCEVEWDFVCAAEGIVLCNCEPPPADCGDGIGNCCIANGTPGCDDVTCCEAVCGFDTFCCEVEWDDFCASVAGSDSLEVECMLCQDFAICGFSTGDCCSANGSPGCEEEDCCNTVCALDPACCDNEWDSICAEAAINNCAGTCNEPGKCGGAGAGDCCVAHDTPACDDIDCCLVVCEEDNFCCDTEWDDLCVQTAQALCGCTPSNPNCPGNGPCNLANGTPGCSDAACCEDVCAIDPTCCEDVWDTICAGTAAVTCVDCGDPGTGNCCFANGTPYCSDASCCELVCAIDPFCCEVSWDNVCAETAQAVCVGPDFECPPCGDPAAGDCQEANGTPACNDAACCETVCLEDEFCCDVAWDIVCANLANGLCGCDGMSPGQGNCLLANGTPGCQNGDCCNAVCAILPECCDIAWDLACADQAVLSCDLCGDITTGNCYEPNGSPYCDDADCCNAVCGSDSFCCDTVWDELCAEEAQDTCYDPEDIRNCGEEGARSCFSPNNTPGCEKEACCQAVCSFDVYCCTIAWDSICVLEANVVCVGVAACPGEGSCLEANDTAGCANELCCNAVCEFDFFCCDNVWDPSCADTANELCIGQPLCPGEGDCFQPTEITPGCDDAICCEVVCRNDIFCCLEGWDSTCASLATEACDGRENCPCIGSCFVAKDSPGCDDASCCNAVCTFFDEICCEEVWDHVCAQVAQELCCPTPSCGSFCLESCFVAHETPYCSDFECCQAVCDIDSFCCVFVWDALCVEQAEDRCSGCGAPGNGSCYTASGEPFCNDLECCAAVCQADFFCCDTEWDQGCVNLAEGDPDKGQPGLCPPAPVCGGEGLGDCCEEHAAPLCDDEECCTLVCDQDSFCCDNSWDGTCVDEAKELCDICPEFPECGDPCAGDCCEEHATPFCEDETCCTLVCEQDAFCCEEVWDNFCANTACQSCDRGGAGMELCNPCGEGAADCCVPHGTPGCNDEDCCNLICDNDPFCCCVSWDASCSDSAINTCMTNRGDPLCPVPECGDPDAGSCAIPNGTPACDDETCCEKVCAADSFCCEEEWDQVCADQAASLCLAGDVCKGATGDCLIANGTPGCDDEKCCNIVCTIDPICCTITWDAICAFEASINCP